MVDVIRGCLIMVFIACFTSSWLVDGGRSWSCSYLLKSDYCTPTPLLLALNQLSAKLFTRRCVCLHANYVLAACGGSKMSLFPSECVGFSGDACSQSVLYQGPADCITVILGQF